MIIKSFDTVAFVSNILMHHLIITFVCSPNSETQLACSVMRNNPGLLFFEGGIFLLRLPVLFVMLAGSWMEMPLLISWRALKANRSKDYTTVFGSERQRVFVDRVAVHNSHAGPLFVNGQSKLTNLGFHDPRLSRLSFKT